jgi:hypothetical protein
MKQFNTINDFDTFDIILDRLKKHKDGEKLYYVRFGDADIFIFYPEFLNKVVGRSNQFLVTPNLQQELYNSWNVVDDCYLVATSLNLDSPESTDHGPKMHNRMRELMNSKVLTERYSFFSHPTFERNFVCKPEKFLEFSNLIYDKKKVWVNQFWHDNVEKILGNVEHHVQTPSTNSYENIDEWYSELLSVIDDVDIVILASGFSSRVVAGRLWKDGINKIVIDIGSVADMFVANTDIFNKIKLRSSMHQHRHLILNSLDYLLWNTKRKTTIT